MLAATVCKIPPIKNYCITMKMPISIFNISKNPSFSFTEAPVASTSGTREKCPLATCTYSCDKGQPKTMESHWSRKHVAAEGSLMDFRRGREDPREYPFSCTKCGRKFRKEKSLSQHRRRGCAADEDSFSEWRGRRGISGAHAVRWGKCTLFFSLLFRFQCNKQVV